MRKLLSVLIVVMPVACSEDPTTTPTTPDPTESVGVAYDDTDTTSVADTLYGHIAIGSLKPSDEVTISGDTILKNDSVPIGFIMEDPDSTSGSLAAEVYNPYGIAPGECWVEIDIEWYPGSGYIKSLTITIVYCVPEEEDNEGGGSVSDSISVVLTCPQETVGWGDYAECSLNTDEVPANVISNIEWSVEGGNATQSGGSAWGGYALETVTIVVRLSILGIPQSPFSGTIAVSDADREWNWIDDYSVSDIGPNGSPCNDWNTFRDMWGQLTPASCGRTVFDHDGYTVDDAGGPWAGMSLVTEKRVDVTLLKALRPDLYMNGPKHPRPDDGNTYGAGGGGTWATILINGCDNAFADSITELNAWQVNTQCGVNTDYDHIVSVIDAHEEEHASDIRKEVESRNITSYWDTLEGSTSYVEDRVRAVLDPAANAVEIAARRADQNPSSNVGDLWRWSEANSGWLWYRVHGAH